MIKTTDKIKETIMISVIVFYVALTIALLISVLVADHKPIQMYILYVWAFWWMVPFYIEECVKGERE